MCVGVNSIGLIGWNYLYNIAQWPALQIFVVEIYKYTKIMSVPRIRTLEDLNKQVRV